MSEGKDKQRKFEMSIEVDAPVEDVWRALTEARELSRWFPIESRVEPGLGGSVFLSWGSECEGTAPITVWEPNRRLQTTERVTPGGDPKLAPVPITVDFYLEGKGGRTVVRLVHSGFDRDAKWDGYLDSITRGWKFELRGLRHYLAHHRGTDRNVIWVRQKTSLSFDEIARRVIGSEGKVLRGSLDGLGEGDPYRLEFDDEPNEHVEGVVQVNGLPRSFAASATNYNNAYLRFEIEDFGGAEAWLWLSTYGVAEDVRDGLKRRWTDALRRALSY